MKKIFAEWVFLFACCFVLTCFLHLPESNHSVNLDLLFLAHVSSSLDVFIPVLLGQWIKSFCLWEHLLK